MLMVMFIATGAIGVGAAAGNHRCAAGHPLYPSREGGSTASTISLPTNREVTS